MNVCKRALASRLLEVAMLKQAHCRLDGDDGGRHEQADDDVRLDLAMAEIVEVVFGDVDAQTHGTDHHG